MADHTTQLGTAPRRSRAIGGKRERAPAQVVEAFRTGDETTTRHFGAPLVDAPGDRSEADQRRERQDPGGPKEERRQSPVTEFALVVASTLEDCVQAEEVFRCVDPYEAGVGVSDPASKRQKIAAPPTADVENGAAGRKLHE